MNSISSRDLQSLSAYLDSQLSRAEAARLEARLASEPDLAQALQALRHTRALLRRTPRRRIPRNFLLNSRMVGIRPPIPRLVPALSWASAVAAALFLITLGSSLIVPLSQSAPAPMMAAAPLAVAGSSESLSTPATPAPTGAPRMASALPQPTLQGNVLALPPKTTQPTAHAAVNPWLILWPALAVLLLVSALLVGWQSQRAFKRRTQGK
jgi:hypothetical protein